MSFICIEPRQGISVSDHVKAIAAEYNALAEQDRPPFIVVDRTGVGECLVEKLTTSGVPVRPIWLHEVRARFRHSHNTPSFCG
jgi:hypothetical protein